MNIDNIILQEKQSDLICPECFNIMSERVVRKGSEYRSRITKLHCSCGYHTYKRTDKEILRDLMIIE